MSTFFPFNHGVVQQKQKPNSTLLNNILGYWTFDELAGDYMYDSVGTYDLSIYKLVQQQQTGKIGYCILSPSEWAVTRGDLSGPEPSQFTVTAWIKPTTLESPIGNNIIASKRAISPNRGFALQLSTLGRLQFYVYNPSDRDATVGYNAIFGGTTIVVDGSWWHVTASYDGQNQRFYVNAVEDENSPSASWTHGVVYDPNNTRFYIGNGVYEDGGFGGYIDEVGFWGRALTQDEITNLYNAGNGKTFPFD